MAFIRDNMSYIGQTLAHETKRHLTGVNLVGSSECSSNAVTSRRRTNHRCARGGVAAWSAA